MRPRMKTEVNSAPLTDPHLGLVQIDTRPPSVLISAPDLYGIQVNMRTYPRIKRNNYIRLGASDAMFTPMRIMALARGLTPPWTPKIGSADRQERHHMATLVYNYALRLDLEAHNLLHAAADAHGLKPGVYGRRILLQALKSKMKEPPVRRRVMVREELRRLLGELGKQGSNLNQLARHCNSPSTAPQLDVLRAMESEQARLILAICRYLGLGDAP
jgi:hypothetical protein